MLLMFEQIDRLVTNNILFRHLLDTARLLTSVAEFYSKGRVLKFSLPSRVT